MAINAWFAYDFQLEINVLSHPCFNFFELKNTKKIQSQAICASNKFSLILCT